MAENTLNNILNSTNYYTFLIQYFGDVKKEVAEKKPSFHISIINNKYAMLSVPSDSFPTIDTLPTFETIVYIKPPQLFTLQEISPFKASQAEFLHLDLPLKLTGKNITIAVIDTGIDYLNEELMDDDMNTRIEFIWDQTIASSTPSSDIPVSFGSIYKKDSIQDAINEYRKGNDPYSIVPSKDKIGHGTKMSGIIGSSGKNPDLIGVAPDCNFIAVKLIDDYAFKSEFNINIPAFNIAIIIATLEVLYQYALMTNTPLIIYFPLGSNLGNHKGYDLLDQFIDNICMTSKIALVTGAGNERVSSCHASGSISVEQPVSIVDIDVTDDEKFLWIEIWVDLPNIITVDVISPSGENSGIIKSSVDSADTYSFVFEKTSIKVNYYVPEEISGDELIRIRFYDLKPGIWKLRLTGDLILDGTYNVWIPQQGLTSYGTHITPADTYGTITNPGNSKYAITAAAYNQTNNNLLNYSGCSFSNDYLNTIDIAAGGVNALTIAPNNSIAFVNGTSVAAAIVAGACSMIFQWGLVEGFNTNMYSQSLKTYLIRGVKTRSGDIYPNPEWGYGMLDILNIFKNIT